VRLHDQGPRPARGRRPEMALHHRFSRQGRREFEEGNGVVATARQSGGHPMRILMLAIAFVAASVLLAAVSAQVPPAIAAPGENAVVTLHAEGAQVYECKAGNDGNPAGACGAPIAPLILDGTPVGRHYAGPTWEHADGSAVVAKAAANVAGQTANDIPWLKLEVTAHRGAGLLSDVTTVQR